MTESDCHLAFSIAPRIGPKRFLDLLKVFGSAHSAWSASFENLKKAGLGEKILDVFIGFRSTFNIELEKKKLKESGIVFIAQCDKVYPQSLKELPNPPIGIFTKGNSGLLSEQNILAVVGSRKTTQYGRDVTTSLVTEIAKQGVVIISGLALGIDAIAHMACIDSKGRTIAVLGCGVDCCYPQENYNLYKKILAGDGLIISEYGLSVPPSKGSFLARNRIIAALSKGILISEATEDSGSLVTADWGEKLGKEIFAVPGLITSQNSYGTLSLIQKGAILVRNQNDILQKFSASGLDLLKSNGVKKPNLSVDQQKIYDVLTDDMDIDGIIRALGFSIVYTNSLLSEMELENHIVYINGKVRRNNNFHS